MGLLLIRSNIGAHSLGRLSLYKRGKLKEDHWPHYGIFLFFSAQFSFDARFTPIAKDMERDAGRSNV